MGHKTRKRALGPRKEPRQARSAEMNELIIEAAIRVLARYPVSAFTTIRVAETAGISIGSLYQYYPNKQAILFALQKREMERTSSRLEAILGDREQSPATRLQRAVEFFFESESEESTLRAALERAEVLYERSDDFQELHQRIFVLVRSFLLEAGRSARTVDFDTQLVIHTVAGLAGRVTQDGASDLRQWTRACSAMLTAQLGLAP